MYYEINVALNGIHFFATAKRSITNESRLKEVFDVFKEKFPPEEGYEITCHQCEERSHQIDIENNFKEMEKW